MSTERGRWTKKSQKLINVVCERPLALVTQVYLLSFFLGMSGSSVISGITFKSSPDASLTTSEATTHGGGGGGGVTALPTRPQPLKQQSRKPSLIRPTQAPPAPPPRKPLVSLGQNRPSINFLLGPRLTDIDLYDSPLASEAAQETYMSSFFQTEPLYQQFYTNQHIKPEDGLSITEDMYECVEHPDRLELTSGMYYMYFFS